MLSFQVSQFRRLRDSLVRDILQACSTFSDRVIYGFRNGRYAEHVFTYGAIRAVTSCQEAPGQEDVGGPLHGE